MLNSGKVALSGLISSLCLVIMIIAGVIPFDLYTLPAISGMLLLVISIEVNYKWALNSFFCTLILSFFMVPNKEAPLVFGMFFGYYPIVKMKIDCIKNKVLRAIIKMLVFNISMILEFFISIKVLSIPEDSFVVFGVSAPVVLLLLGNLAFWIYDKALTDAIKIYFLKLRSKIKKILRF